VKQRRHARIPVELKVFIAVNRKSVPAICADVLDISEGGAKLICHTRIRRGQAIRIEFPPKPHPGHQVVPEPELRGVVRWSNPEQGIYGIEFSAGGNG